MCTSPDRPDGLSLEDREGQLHSDQKSLKTLQSDEAHTRLQPRSEEQRCSGEAFYQSEVEKLDRKGRKLIHEGRPGIPVHYNKTVIEGGRAAPAVAEMEGGMILQNLAPARVVYERRPKRPTSDPKARLRGMDEDDENAPSGVMDLQHSH